MKSPWLSAAEWETLEAFLGVSIANRKLANGAFWENTYANDHDLNDTYVRHAWLGDRVLNLALAERIDSKTTRSRSWDGTDSIIYAQSGYRASSIVQGWSQPIQDLLRLGNTWGGRSVPARIHATYGEAIIGVLFQDHGYPVARDFVWSHWH